MPPDQPFPPSTSRWRLGIFLLLCATATGGIIAYALHARAKMLRQAEVVSPILSSDDAAQLAATRRQPHLLFRNTALGPAYGRIAAVSLVTPAGPRFITPLTADRVHGNAGGGFYLRAMRRALTTYEGVAFDAGFKTLHTFQLAGAPSRTRVSPDGRLAASTVFVSGDSYNTGGFSTRTTLYDLSAAAVIADLEGFVVLKDGQPFKNADFNFWGVTFAADHDHFYATLATGDVPYLVEGRVARREARVLRAGIECPSLSPDGSRVAFKSRRTENGRRVWQVHVLNLQTQAEVVVAETRNVDDQVEWLDDANLLYALPRDQGGTGHADIWVASADGTGAPKLFVSDGTSPCVVRP